MPIWTVNYRRTVHMPRYCHQSSDCQCIVQSVISAATASVLMTLLTLTLMTECTADTADTHTDNSNVLLTPLTLILMIECIDWYNNELYWWLCSSATSSDDWMVLVLSRMVVYQWMLWCRSLEQGLLHGILFSLFVLMVWDFTPRAQCTLLCHWYGISHHGCAASGCFCHLCLFYRSMQRSMTSTMMPFETN